MSLANDRRPAATKSHLIVRLADALEAAGGDSKLLEEAMRHRRSLDTAATLEALTLESEALTARFRGDLDEIQSRREAAIKGCPHVEQDEYGNGMRCRVCDAFVRPGVRTRKKL